MKIMLLIILLVGGCAQDQDPSVRAYECKKLCTDGEVCPGSTASECNEECLSYEAGEDYCPGRQEPE